MAVRSLFDTNLYEEIAKRKKKTVSKEDRLMEGVDIWTSYWRANPHRFVEDFLGFKLKLFQQILIYVMMHFDYFTYIASRGQGKTLLTAIYAVTRMILYPETKIVVAAGQKSQGRETVTKIKELAIKSPLLRNELLNGMKGIYDSVNEPKVEVKGGSWLRVVSASDGARGGRANLLIVDEFRLVSTETVNTVLKKMQAGPRFPAFLNKPEYRDNPKYHEMNKQIFLSSAWFKAHESWDRVQTYNDGMTDGQSYFGCAIPYQVSVMEGLKSRKEIENEMSERDFNEIMWAIEMEAIFWGQNLSSFFKYDEIQKNRIIEKVYYPKEIRDVFAEDILSLPKKEIGEKRTISGDIALSGGDENDNTIFTIARSIPTKNGYETSVMYMESHNGGHTDVIANRIRQLFYDYECDYFVLDGQNQGQGIFDALNKPTTDPERGTEYPPWNCFNNEKFSQRCAYPYAEQVVYVIMANEDLNSKIATRFKDSLAKGRIKFPVNEEDAKQIFTGYEGYKNLDKEYQTKLKLPYVQITLMTTEMLELTNVNIASDKIKLKESRGFRKDRYSSVSYLDYFVNDYLELKNRKNNAVDASQFSQMFKMRESKRSRSRQSGMFF